MEASPVTEPHKAPASRGSGRAGNRSPAVRPGLRSPAGRGLPGAPTSKTRSPAGAGTDGAGRRLLREPRQATDRSPHIRTPPPGSFLSLGSTGGRGNQALWGALCAPGEGRGVVGGSAGRREVSVSPGRAGRWR